MRRDALNGRAYQKKRTRANTPRVCKYKHTDPVLGFRVDSRDVSESNERE